MAVGFDKAGTANHLIEEHTSLGHTDHFTERYDQSYRIVQCSKCMTNGHPTYDCDAHSSTCGHCAEQHSTRDWPLMQPEGLQPKCAFGTEKHDAWYSSCKSEIAQENFNESASPTRRAGSNSTTRPPLAELNAQAVSTVATFNFTPTITTIDAAALNR